jgi:hypothetical protein
MANTITVRVLVDGPTVTNLEITGVLDTSDLSGFVVADPTALEVVDQLSQLQATGLGVVSIPYYSIEDGLEVELYFEASTPDVFSVLAGRGKMQYYKEGFRRCYNSAPTGRILMNTFGFATGGEFTFTIKLELRKQTA